MEFLPEFTSECCWLAASKAFSPSEVTPWQYADSLTIRQFLGLKLTDHSPDHTSLTVVRERLPSEVHHTVFQRVLGLTNSKVLLVGKTVAVDSSTLEADAAMKSIGRRDSPSDRKGHKTTNQPISSSPLLPTNPVVMSLFVSYQPRPTEHHGFQSELRPLLLIQLIRRKDIPGYVISS